MTVSAAGKPTALTLGGRPLRAWPAVIEGAQWEKLLGILDVAGENADHPELLAFHRACRPFVQFGQDYSGQYAHGDGQSYSCRRQLWGHPDNPTDLDNSILVEYIDFPDGTYMRTVAGPKVLALALQPATKTKQGSGVIVAQGNFVPLGQSLGGALLDPVEIEATFKHEREHAMGRAHDCNQFTQAMVNAHAHANEGR